MGGPLVGDRSDQEGVAVHVLVWNVGRLRVVGEVHEERPHIGRACLIAAIGIRIGVGEELVAQFQVTGEDRLCLLAIGPELGLLSLAVHPHHGLKRAPLEPSDEQFRVILVVSDHVAGVRPVDERPVDGVIIRRELGRHIPGDVRVPVGEPARGEVQSCGYGALQHVPG